MIGRSSECQIVVADPRVSRRHAMIRIQDGGHYLFDLGSFNGSYLNGSRVTAARQLRNGDVLTFAEHEFQFTKEGESKIEEGTMDQMGGSTIALIRSTPVIILVSDIKAYTALSEALEADDLAQIIGTWYSDCENIITSAGGTVDKFIGDCVLAYWTKVDETTLNASLRSAEALLASSKRIYQDRPDIFDKITQKLEIGIALHTGKVAYGGMGQGEFTLVGDPVNLTFRLETLTRSLNYDVLLSGEMARALPDSREHTTSLGVHKVKGRAQGVEVFGVTSFPEQPG
ncbi:MAG: hypothetical protein CMO55_13115 [Verrucomicrobiales bacterium]|nr:hypothetical protein [Verrucomicrobiales bacterium]